MILNNNNMRRLTTGIIVMILMMTNPLSSYSQQVSKESAMDKAVAFVSKLEKTEMVRNRIRHSTFNDTPVLSLAYESTELFIFNDDNNGGYYIVSGDERMPDILGYSLNDRFDTANIPINLKSLLNVYSEQVKYLQTHPKVKTKQLTPVVGNPIDAMLTCKWGQGEPYNGLCPLLNEQNTYTGCLATAMAQIMYYHKWPLQTTDVIPEYTTTSFNILVNEIPVTTIDWDNMINEYTEDNYTPEQAKAVATLMKLCGAAVQMDYCDYVSGSTMDMAEYVLTQYFGYDDALVHYNSNACNTLNQDEWIQLIYDELSNGRPVLYGGANYDSYIGHAFVVDGYDGNGYFHVNLGWGDLTNSTTTEGYYLLTDVEGFSVNQEAIVGIQKPGPDAKKAYGILDENGTMTLYYDRQKGKRKGTVYDNVRSLSENNDMKACIIDPSFADYPLGSLYGYFFNCKNLKTVTGLKYMNTTYVTDMSGLFSRCESLENIDFDGFYTGKVRMMSDMFYHCSSLKTLDLSGFNTENVEWMYEMFCECSSLESIDLSSFNTAKVVSMYCMFEDCSSLRSLDVSNFDTHSVIDMGMMFRYCDNLQSLDVTNFNTENVNSMGNMFDRCASLTSLDVSRFNTKNVESMNSMFRECTSLKQLDLSNFDTSKAISMTEMFQHCYSLEQLNLSSFNTSNVTDMNYMFQECNSLKTLDIRHFDTSNVTSMELMFYGCSTLTSLDLTHFDTSNVTNMRGMLGRCTSLTSIDVSGFNTEKVTNMSCMFQSCTLKSLNLSNFNTENVTDLSGMFDCSESLETIDISSFNTTNVTNMAEMFKGCTALKRVDISNFNTSNVVNMRTMFSECHSLARIYVGDEWSTEKVEDDVLMFFNCYHLVGGMGTKYQEDHVGKEYAHIDGGLDNPGYLMDVNLAQTDFGDANDDGTVNAADIVEVVNYIMGNPSDGFNEAAADANGDGVVNAADIVMIVNIIMGN